MAQKTADPCRNCGAALAPGAVFCTLCGTTVNNRAAGASPASVPLGGPTPYGSVPGIVPVDTTTPAPVVPPRQMGVDPRAAKSTALAHGGAGRRFAAWIIDCAVPGILIGVAALIGSLLIKVTPIGNESIVDFSWLVILTSVAVVLSLGYWIWTWLWDAKQGKTLGNVFLGLRTTNMEGHPAGLLAIFLRYLIVGVSSVVPTIGPILVVLSNAWDSNGKKQGWHDKVAHTLVFNVRSGRNPLETGGIAEREAFTPAEVPTISQVSSPLVATPSGWDASGTISSGTNSSAGQAQQTPLAAATFASGPAASGTPAPETPVSGSSTPGSAGPTRSSRWKKKKGPAVDPFAPPAVQFHNQQPQQPQQPQNQQPQQQDQVSNFFAPPMAAQQPQMPVAPGPITSVPGVTQPGQQNGGQQDGQSLNSQPNAMPIPPAGQTPTQHDLDSMAQADDDAGETRIRPVGQQLAMLRLIFDDGRTEDVNALALIGRNPAGYDGEMISRLISVADSSRSVSKTHLHLRVSSEGLWVTDRNSTNGSAVTSTGGMTTSLSGGTPVLVQVGARVQFGDRSFTVARV